MSRRLIDTASEEYRVGAWLSAEKTAWDAVRWAAESIDLASREQRQGLAQSALDDLQFARNAIREARDFAGTYGEIDADAIARMARSHQTDILDDVSTDGMTATDAYDRYLDEARVSLARVATASVEAAQAMDLLAAIYLSRADLKTLPSATALCLRRAALQGQPGNASLAGRLGMHLADVGLNDEARWALEHSLSLEQDTATSEALARVLRRIGNHYEAAELIARTQAGVRSVAAMSQPRIPEVTELSPADFAALSKPVQPPKAPTTTSIDATLASARINKPDQGPSAAAEEAAAESVEPSKPGLFRRILKSMTPKWRD